MSTTATAAAAPPPLPAARDPKLRHMADALRALAMDSVEQAKSGHPGMPMGMADIATGSEVSVAMAAREALAEDHISAAVVSMPCWELFEQAPKEYRDAVLGSAPRVAVEAAVQFGWERWLGPRGAFIGMQGYGASAPGEALFPHFGITAERVAATARSLL
jgi:transketolase